MEASFTFGMIRHSRFFQEVIYDLCTCDFLTLLVDHHPNVLAEATTVIVSYGFCISKCF
jgi:hypothetical protein